MDKDLIAFPYKPGTDAEGMTLRDYFAAAVIQGLLANPKLSDQILRTGGARGGWVEESAWAWADSMIEKRN